MNLNKISLDEMAKEISELEDMPNDDSYFEACYLVAMDFYDLDKKTATKVADIIQEKYL